METVIDQIRRAAETLSFSPSELRELPVTESALVFGAALDRFVASGDRQWWWEDFRVPGASMHFPDSDGWRHLVHIAPHADECVWFIAQDPYLAHYPVYETSVRHAMAVVGECYGFEFYLVAKDLSWLLCETHHDVVYAVGEAVEQRLRSHGT
ncbi:MAG: DUF6756 family protein [Pseudomonadota bacterium]